MGHLKTILRGLMPAALLAWHRERHRRDGFFGDYPNWDSARRASDGYDSPEYFERIKTRPFRPRTPAEALNVTRSLGPIAFLQHIKRGSLRVLDFGGGFGGTWEQCRPYLGQNVRWTVVEQPVLARHGQSALAGDGLTFSDSIDQALRPMPDVVLFSTVLQYLPEPKAYIDKVAAAGVPFILVDRLPVWNGGRNRIVVQRVPPKYFDISMPAHVFDEQAFLEMFGAYTLVATFDDPEAMRMESGLEARFRGYFFRRRPTAHL